MFSVSLIVRYTAICECTWTTVKLCFLVPFVALCLFHSLFTRKYIKIYKCSMWSWIKNWQIFLMPLMKILPLILLTQCSTVLVKLTVVKLVKKLPAFHETERSMKIYYLNFTHLMFQRLKVMLSTCRATMGEGRTAWILVEDRLRLNIMNV